MVMHHKQPKHRGQPLKPEAGPVGPDLSVELPPLPQTLPSYMSISRPIRAARISEERHAKLAPRIAANLSTWTPLGEASDSTSLRTPRRPKLSEKLVASLESGEARDVGLGKAKSPVRGAYDYWLEARALRRVRRLCDDMPSRAVTDMFAKGLIIDNDWLARGEPEWEVHEQDADSVTDYGDDELPFIEEARQPEVADGGMRNMGPAGDVGDGVSAVVAEAEELHALHTLADGPSQQPSWEVLPDASETE
ncbi:hypothetical protein PHLGIDRAFT_241012 [Phlebiopsis gigantea 11061_1 CR5-6]|uniref:Uncharacterized protein n=1 Tax=Phlebiopsis gigantea (strain 11061_1 CR5-6) TaxID=745531 RepID=A0A0C3S422_PHLG1|nr:hypothetical protein PHLGIDRAFT_241012 [Phlebiopsis gigantea 11061_1 CR5-6]